MGAKFRARPAVTFMQHKCVTTSRKVKKNWVRHGHLGAHIPLGAVGIEKNPFGGNVEVIFRLCPDLSFCGTKIFDVDGIRHKHVLC